MTDTDALTLAAVVVAVAAAGRSTWSPCGLSMLSTITPLGERARGHRWGATAAWFVAGRGGRRGDAGPCRRGTGRRAGRARAAVGHGRGRRGLRRRSRRRRV